MKLVKTVPDSTFEFLKKTTELYGEIKKDSYDVLMAHYLYDIGISSPIEQVFFIALHLQCKEMGFEFRDDEFINHHNQFRFVLSAMPQKRIGNFRVDFLLQLTQGTETSQLIVELDGHQFHEKDKQQRSYEKARDRYFVKTGYKVFHYTGSDVVAKPHHIAYEVMKALGAIYCTDESVEEYDPNNRLGWDHA